MPTSDPLTGLELPAGVRLELLPPKNRRAKHPLPVWAVWLGSEQIGRIEQWRVRSSTSTFYRATTLHPHTDKPIPLESSTDLTERVTKVIAAWRDPDGVVRRWPWA